MLAEACVDKLLRQRCVGIRVAVIKLQPLVERRVCRTRTSQDSMFAHAIHCGDSIEGHLGTAIKVARISLRRYARRLQSCQAVKLYFEKFNLHSCQDRSFPFWRLRGARFSSQLDVVVSLKCPDAVSDPARQKCVASFVINSRSYGGIAISISLQSA